MKTLDRYNAALSQISPPGSGCHVSLLSVANLGTLAGVDTEQIFQDIREHIPHGNRHVPDKEIWDAINKALSDHSSGIFVTRPRSKPIVSDGKATLQRIIEQGKIIDTAGLRECSPISVGDEPQRDLLLLIETLCKPDDLLWVGDRHQAGILGDTIRSAVDWYVFLKDGGKTAPFIIINPLTGIPTMKKSGAGQTCRGDGNTSSYRYAMAEFDNLTLEEQIRFWSAIKLPIIALIHSGGKSIHAWLQVSKIAPVTTFEQWQSEIKGHLYQCLLGPLGVDNACSNPARLSRLPGHYRAEKETYQRLLWLSPEGRPICH
jgi:hypothetical protein